MKRGSGVLSSGGVRVEKQSLQVASRLGISEVLRSLKHYLGVQSQGHPTIEHLEEREA